MLLFRLFLKMSFQNIRAYWRQSIAAIISVIAGFSTFVIFEGYLNNIYTVYKQFNTNLEMYGDLIIEKKGASTSEGRADPWNYSLTQNEQEKIQQFFKSHTSQIETYSRFLQVTGSIDTSNSSSVFQGLAMDVIEATALRGPWKWDTYWGQPLQNSASTDLQMVVGLRLAQKLGCLSDELPDLKKYAIDVKKNPHSRPFLCENESFQLSAMTETGPINATELSVSGILDKGFIERDSRYVAFSLPTAQKLFNTEKISYYAVKLNPSANVQDFIQEFKSTVDSRIAITSWTDHEFGVLYQKTLSLLNVIRFFLISIIVFIGSMSVFNTLVKLVKERTKEIGMLRSLGFLPSHIRKLFLTESILLSWTGCLIGTLISLLFSLIINQMEITYPSGQFSTETEFIIEISFWPYFYGFLLMSIISTFACWIAVRKISVSNIAESLLHY